jgi:predicted nucleotidyltransferase
LTMSSLSIYHFIMKSAQEEIEMMRGFIRRKRRERSERLSKKLAQARADFSAIVKMIITDYNPEHIYQWGSLVDGKGFQDISDIDIAVAGIKDPKIFSELYRKAKERTAFPLHIVQLEFIHPLYASDIVSKGVLIYERQVQ